DVHQLPSAPMSEATVDGYPRQVWWNADGETIVESYTITDMAHGTPLGIGDNDKRSEEHTSELQSRFDLVCRLLLEKKKKKKIPLLNVRKIQISTRVHVDTTSIDA